MLQQNRISRYLLYALGEIILVVAGILIALQINTWNDQRKARIQEKQMLINIKEALQTDLEKTIKENIAESEVRIHTAQSLISARDRGIRIPDSIQKTFISLGMNREFRPVVTPFRILESRGLDLISNEELKYAIIDLYTLEYGRLGTLIENETFNLRDVYRPHLKKHFNINPPSHSLRFEPVDINKMLEDRDFMNAITILYSNNLDLIRVLKNLRPGIDEIILEIDREINARS